MCGSFSPISDVTAAVAAQPEAPAKQPRLVPRSNRRFYKGEWQKPSRLQRGWQPSEGLAGMTYEQGVTRLAYLNRNRPNPFVNVTTEDQLPWSETTPFTPNALVEGSVITDDPAVETPNAAPAADVDEFENFLNTEAARLENDPFVNPTLYPREHTIRADLPSEFAASFAPIVTKLENGGVALVMDSNTTLTMLRGVGIMGGRDKKFSFPLMEAFQAAYPAMVQAGLVTVIDSPVVVGFGAERA